MTLRRRLFLLVGGLFLVVFIISDYLGGFLTKKKLLEEEKALRIQMVAVNEEKRQHVQAFLTIALADTQARMDTLLEGISEYQGLQQRFAPSAKNEKYGSWVFASHFLLNNKDLDLLQNTADGKVYSLILPHPNEMKAANKIPIEKDVYWVAIRTGEKTSQVCMGILLEMNVIEHEGGSSFIGKKEPDFLVLFDWKNPLFYHPIPESALKIDESFFSEEFFGSDYKIHLQDFFNALASAGTYLQQGQQATGQAGMQQWVDEQIEAKTKNQPLTIFSQHDGYEDCHPSQNADLNDFLHLLQERDDQIVMMSGLSSLMMTQAFGLNPFDERAPVGAGKFSPDSNGGDVFFVSEVFSQTPIFNAEAYAKANPPKTACWNVSSSMAVMKDPQKQRLFFGNVLQVPGNQGPGYLTLGQDLENTLTHLAFAINQACFVVHNHEVVSGYSSEGKKFPFEMLQKIPLKSIENKTSGVVNWEGKNYFFIQMTPFEGVDLHFYAVTLESKAFALVDSLDKGTKNIISLISLNMQILAVLTLFITFFLLHRLSKKITKPIATLAKATHDVAEGNLNDIHLPKIPYSEKDEISILYNSFESMVRGLIEKEKVKGVLNKVVSPQVAQEILKGTVHLGGEEKTISVLFADIRSFTSMTQKMLPHEVIELLNTCMTKISRVIDEYGGVIDKYVGDEVMALFGAPIASEENALHAVKCAVKILEVLGEWNRERQGQGLIPIEMGIGVHTGLVVAGNMGAENRLNYTVLGRNVNLAARLCAAAHRMQILISDDTLHGPHVEEHLIYEKQTAMTLKGFDQPIDVYLVKGLK